MKLFIAIMMLATLALAEEKVKSKEDVKKYHKECMEELKIPADILKIHEEEDYEEDEDKKGVSSLSVETKQCIVRCLMEKCGFFNEDTGFNAENLYKYLQILKGGNKVFHGEKFRAAVIARIMRCADRNTQGGKSVCEWAYNGSGCIFMTIRTVEFINFLEF